MGQLPEESGLKIIILLSPAPVTGGKRQEAGGKRQEAGGKRQKEGNLPLCVHSNETPDFVHVQ